MRKLFFFLLLISGLAKGQTPVNPQNIATHQVVYEPSTSSYYDWYGTANGYKQQALSPTGQSGKVLGSDGVHFMWTTGGGSGVTTFNTRTGSVVPQAGDYAPFYPTLVGNNTLAGTNTLNGPLISNDYLQVNYGTAINYQTQSLMAFNSVKQDANNFGNVNTWLSGYGGYLDYKLVPTSVKTSAYTISINDFVLTNTTSGVVPITLPTAPFNGAKVAVMMVIQGGTNATTVTAGGTDVINKAGVTSITLLTTYEAKTLEYWNGVWYVKNGNLSLASLDTRYGVVTPITAGSCTNCGLNLDLNGRVIGYSSGTGGGTTTNALTLNNSGTGAASGSTFNGSSAITLSYNTIGADPLRSGTGYLKFSGPTGSYISAIPNSDLANSTISGTSLGGNLAALTIGTHLTGTSYNGTGAVALGTDATPNATLSTIASRDANGNIALNAISQNLAIIVSASGTTTLTAASAPIQIITGTATQIIKLPVVSTLTPGSQYLVINNTNGNQPVQSSGGNAVLSLTTNTSGVFIYNGTAGTGAPSWNSQFNPQGSLLGTANVWTATNQFTSSLNAIGEIYTFSNSNGAPGSDYGRDFSNLYVGSTGFNSFNLTAPHQLFLGGSSTFAHAFFIGNTAGSVTAGATGANVVIGSSPVNWLSSTTPIPIVASLMVRPPTSTGSGSASLTNAVNAYFAGAPTATVTGGNYDIWAVGLNRMSGLQIDTLTASKPVFTDANKQLTNIGPGPSYQVVKGDGSIGAAPLILSTITGVNAKTTGTTVLYTVPASVKLIVTAVRVFATTASGATVAASADIGDSVNGAASVYTNASTGVFATGNVFTYVPGGVSKTPASGSTVNFNINTAATATTLTYTIILEGELL